MEDPASGAIYQSRIVVPSSLPVFLPLPFGHEGSYFALPINCSPNAQVGRREIPVFAVGTLVKTQVFRAVFICHIAGWGNNDAIRPKRSRFHVLATLFNSLHGIVVGGFSHHGLIQCSS